MSASDFRQLTVKDKASKAERLFRASITAFCSLTRPSRRDATQLQDLTLPLLDRIPAEARRYAAAVLSECPALPPDLVKRLCEDSIDVAAPLLIKSAALSDIDLIALIGRHGEGHARAIGRRQDLHPTVAALAAAVEKTAQDRPAAPKPATPVAIAFGPQQQVAPAEDDGPRSGEAAENTRRRLRAMMVPAGTRIDPLRGVSTFAKLRETALTGNLVFFQTALADALEAPLHAARMITGDTSQGMLAEALLSLGLTEEQAFVVAAAVRPERFSHAESIRLFLTRYRLLHPDVATTRTRTLVSESVAAVMTARGHRLPAPANESVRGEPYRDFGEGRPLKASL